MASKLQNIYELSEHVSRELSGYENWTAFLKSTAWQYKYPFHDQLLIYAQRPDATACANISVLLPTKIQMVIYLWYTARQVQTMLLLPQIPYLDLRQDRAAIKTNTEDWPLWGFSSVFFYCISYIVTLFFVYNREKYLN